MHPRKLLDARLRDEYGGADEDAAVLGAELTDDEWAVVSKWESRIAVGDQAIIERALQGVVDGRRAHVLPRRRERRQPSDRPDATRRSEALAALFVSHLEASGDPAGVVAFRAEVLRRRLLAPRTVARWIKTKPESAGAVSARTLAYRVPNSEWTQYVRTSAGSVLDRLRATSDRVSAFTGWAPAHATVFVLTGTVPGMTAVKAEVRYQPTMSVRSRVVLTIDPASTPAEVTAAYRRFRRNNFGRVRRLSAKHTALAKFVLERSAIPAREQMTQWNAARPQWRFRQLKEFTRNSQRAVHRLANPFRPLRLK